MSLARAERSKPTCDALRKGKSSNEGFSIAEAEKGFAQRHVLDKRSIRHKQYYISRDIVLKPGIKNKEQITTFG